MQTGYRVAACSAAFGLIVSVLGAGLGSAAPAEKPAAGREVRFPTGAWSGLPQTGPDGKVRQCVLVARRPRVLGPETVDTALTVAIGRGAGLAFALRDDKLPPDAILDDEAQVIVDDHSFPAVAFSVAPTSLVIHPGDAAGVLAALAKAKTLQLRSAGDGLDTGAMPLDLPADALAWLVACGQEFKIAIDKPSDPDAPALPVPRPPSPEVGSNAPTAAGPPGIEDVRKIAAWDASQLRGTDGRVLVCLMRRHYMASAERGRAAKARVIGTFLMVSRAKGLSMMLKDSDLNLPDAPPVAATLAIDGKPFTGFSAQALGADEIGIFPQHGAALAAALGDGAAIDFDAGKIERMQFSIGGGVVPWLRACARRWNIPFEAAAKPQ